MKREVFYISLSQSGKTIVLKILERKCYLLIDFLIA